MIAAGVCPSGALRRWLRTSVAAVALLLSAPALADEPADATNLSAGNSEQPLAAGVSASELQEAIDSIKRRVAAQQDSRATTASSELVAELHSARETIAELSQSLAGLRSERDALQGELEVGRKASATAATALAAATQDAAVAQDALAESLASAEADRDAVLVKSRESLDTLSEQNTILEAELASERDLRRVLAADLESAETDKLASEKAIVAMRGELDGLETALEDARNRLAERDAGLVAAATAAGELESRLTEADAAIAMATQEIADRDAELAAASTATGELVARLTRADAAVATAKKELADRDAELAAASTATSELEARLAEADAAVAMATQDLAERAAQLDTTRSALEERLASAESDRSAAEEALAASETARLASERQVVELRAVASQSVTEIETMGETLLETLAENQQLVTALTDARGSRTLIENELKAMRQDLESYAAAPADSIAQATTEDAEIPLALVASDAVVEELDADLIEASVQIAVLTEELIARDKQLASAGAEGDVDALSQQIGLLEQTVEALSAENATMAGRLEALQADADLAAPELITALLAPDEAVEHFLGQLNAVDTGDGWWMTVPEGLVFAPGRDDLADGTDPVIAQIAALIGYFGDAPVRIVGHTDSFGDADVNRQLSLQRATVVGQQLVDSFGVDGARIVTEGFGEELPIASNGTIEGRRANRRVEVYIKR